MTTVTIAELLAGLESRDKAFDAEPTEAQRIEALAAEGNRRLLIAIGRSQPRSVSELARLVSRQQSNVSRSLLALTRAGLVELRADGKASVPLLTAEGQRRFAELIQTDEGGEVDAASAQELAFPFVVSVQLPELSGDLLADAVEGDLLFEWADFRAADTTDLNEVVVRLLSNWWRNLYRRDDPFRIFALRLCDGQHRTDHIVAILSRVVGDRVSLTSRSSTTEFGNSLQLMLSQRSFSELLLNRLVRPVADQLEVGRRLDRPLHSLLARLEDVETYANEREFARSAGALGLSPYDLSDEAVRSVQALLATLPDESARLEFASAMIPETFDAVFGWARSEVRTHQSSNTLEDLVGLHRQRPIASNASLKPWRIGTECARHTRTLLGLEPSRSVGGVEGIVKLLEGSRKFALSRGGEEQPRAYISQNGDKPLIVVREHDAVSSAFALARAVGDYIVFGNQEAAISSLYTDRQKVGRAFAAEFMAPAEGVISMVEDDDRSHLAVAAHYGVAPNVINRQYSNNAELDREDDRLDRLIA